MTDAVDFSQLEDAIDPLREEFRGAAPYPHVVIDDFLTADAVADVYDELDRLDEGTWTKYLHLNERKYASTDPTQWGSGIARVTAELLSERFTAFLTDLSGVDGLIADPTLDGGGLHRSTRGGFLNVHADFTAHHQHENWRRRINLILYLNRRWDEAWGGNLELWDADMTRCEGRVSPIGNRALIFETSDDSFHGHPDPMTCPDGVARQSLALYYFTEEAERHIHSTNYRPRPDDGVKAIGIALDRNALRLYDVLKRRLRLSDGAVSNMLGRLDRLRPEGREPPIRRKPTNDLAAPMTDTVERTESDVPSDRAATGTTRRLEQVPALDGFRGLAVVLVMLVHLQLIVPFEQTGVEPIDAFIRGGFLGVDLFFVLSGFLITALLLNELDRRRSVGYRSFYIRRGLRLLPALYIFLIAHLGFAIAANLEMDREIPSILSALFYVTNWQQVVAPDSLAHHFTHLWSLSIEEQFYLIWPATLIGYLGLRKNARYVGRVLVVVIVAVVVWRAWLFSDPQIFWPELVVRTDTRIDALLIGALLASLWVRRATPTRGLVPAAWIASVVLVACVVSFDGPDDFVYQGGLTVVAVAASVIVLALIDGSWVGARFFEWRPLQGIGRVSYGVYLWHYPIFFVVGRYLPDVNAVLRVGIALAITAAAVAGSWFVVERPALALKQRWGGHSTPTEPQSPPARLAIRWSAVAALAFGLGFGIGAIIGEEPVSSEEGAFPLGDADRAGYWAYASLAPAAGDAFGDVDTFGESEGEDWEIVSGDWAVDAGEARLVGADGVALAVLDDERIESEGVIEVAMMQVEPRAGLVFRYQDPDNHWSIIANDQLDGWIVQRRLVGDTELISEVPIAPEPGVTISVTQGGLSLRILLDGVLQVELFDDALGDILRGGLIADAGTDDGGARWDRFAVYRPAPEELPG